MLLLTVLCTGWMIPKVYMFLGVKNMHQLLIDVQLNLCVVMSSDNSKPTYSDSVWPRLSLILQVCANTDAKVESFRTQMEPLRQTLKTNKFLGGSQPNYADIAVAGNFLVREPCSLASPAFIMALSTLQVSLFEASFAAGHHQLCPRYLEVTDRSSCQRFCPCPQCPVCLDNVLLVAMSVG